MERQLFSSNYLEGKVMALFTIEYCPYCREQTEHINNKCVPCLKNQKLEKEEFDKLSDEEKFNFLFNRFYRSQA